MRNYETERAIDEGYLETVRSLVLGLAKDKEYNDHEVALEVERILQEELQEELDNTELKGLFTCFVAQGISRIDWYDLAITEYDDLFPEDRTGEIIIGHAIEWDELLYGSNMEEFYAQEVTAGERIEDEEEYYAIEGSNPTYYHLHKGESKEEPFQLIKKLVHQEEPMPFGAWLVVYNSNMNYCELYGPVPYTVVNHEEDR